MFVESREGSAFRKIIRIRQPHVAELPGQTRSPQGLCSSLLDLCVLSVFTWSQWSVQSVRTSMRATRSEMKQGCWSRRHRHRTPTPPDSVRPSPAARCSKPVLEQKRSSRDLATQHHHPSSETREVNGQSRVPPLHQSHQQRRQGS